MPIQVLLVDDSAFLRHKVTQQIQLIDPDIVVVGQARDGLEALEKIAELHPNVVVLDVEMPKLNGLAALKRIMVECPTPVIMLSALTQQGARITIQALMAGAVDFMPKPVLGDDFQTAMVELCAKIKTAAGAVLVNNTIGPLKETPVFTKPGPIELRRTDPLIVIGASTGGPRAIHQLLTDLPGDFPGAILVVQHMPAGFTQSLAQRINGNAALHVEEATQGRILERGLVLLAPGDYHLQLTGDCRVHLSQGPRRNYVRPAVDVTMEAAARSHEKHAIGIILTGMGSDGREGAASIKALGGRIIAEHESTCVVYGMPRSVIEAGLADQILPLSKIAPTLVEMIKSNNK